MFAFAVSTAALSPLSRTSRRIAVTAATLFLLLASSLIARADKWQVPTPEELSMTSQPQVPGAAAVYLFREELNDDNMHMHSVYVRLKVLTDKGKSYADVSLPYFNETSIGAVEGRTIHPDGSIVEFTGKPYTKELGKDATHKVQAKVFTLPAVDVGSIIEYRYVFRYDDNALYSAKWYVQQDLYLRAGHFVWKPYGGSNNVIGEDGKIEDRIAWAQILQAGAKVEPKAQAAGKTYYELNINNVMPLVDEESSPPMNSISERVLFYYTGATSQGDYWKGAGKNWSKRANSFIGPGKAVTAEVAQITTPSDTPEAKLRKIYADVQKLDNTSFTREHSRAEAKIAKNTDDVLAQKSGNNDQLTMLFIAMARAAGLKAQAAVISNRDEEFFWPSYLSMNQLDDMIAIVTLDGKEVYLDPGQRDCPYGQMNWKHMGTQGLRQTDSGTDVATTPSMAYTVTQTQHIGDLKMAEDGAISGTVTVNWTGALALRWRQSYRRTDETELRRDLKDSLEETLPIGVTTTILRLQNLDDYEKPLTAVYFVEGHLGTATSKRIIVQAEFFQTKNTPRFSTAKRTNPIDLHYGARFSDAVRITLPDSMHWEAPPKPENFVMKTSAQYQTSAELKGNALTMRRNMDIGQSLYLATDYQELHDFYAKVATADDTQAIISLSPGAAAPAKSANPAPATPAGGSHE